jgi:hypothetical protein
VAQIFHFTPENALATLRFAGLAHRPEKGFKDWSRPAARAFMPPETRFRDAAAR